MAEQAEVLYLARCPEVINVKEGLFDVETIWPKLEAALQQAIGNLVGCYMDIKLINIGFGNIVAANRIISIISPESAPI